MRRIWQAAAGGLLAFCVVSELRGWEMSTSAQRASVPANARNAAGYRAWHFWNGGK